MTDTPFGMTPEEYQEQYGLARELNLRCLAILNALGDDPLKVPPPDMARPTWQEAKAEFGTDRMALSFAVMGHLMMEMLQEHGLSRETILQRLAARVVQGGN